MPVHELNLDGLVGPTHHYAGLAPGNLASTMHAKTSSNPAEAALQGIHKMRVLHEIGVKQAVLPPHPRPNLAFLDALGLSSTRAQKNNPTLLSAAYSASSMWAANAATVTPSTDTQDGRVHITAANLVTHLHRHQEADFSHQLFKRIFPDTNYFRHHPILPKTPDLNDEGAANHNRFSAEHGAPGFHLFVFDREAEHPSPTHFPARQTREASEAIARNHGIASDRVLFAAQTPKAIDAGVFHNDVIALANESVFLLHQDAFLNQTALLEQLQQKTDFPIQLIEITREMLSLEDAVQSYIFNSQLVTLPNSSNMALIAPDECQKTPAVKALIEHLLALNNPISEVHYVALKQSMHNGGGPACLRLRMPLNDDELKSMHPGILVNHNLLDTLEAWVNTHYRTELCLNDLLDPSLAKESCVALKALEKILDLGDLYSPM
jgi:succinylarginine dihydrolase